MKSHHLTLSIFLVWSLFLYSPSVSAQDSDNDTTAVVHFVYGSDTSTPGIGISTKTKLYPNGGHELYFGSGRNAETIMNESYRNQFLDSFGNPLVLTWWMQGGSLYSFAENTNVPFGGTMSQYLMNRYQGDAVEALGDEWSYHYHNWIWSDENGDDVYYWNQGRDFTPSIEDFEQNLAMHLIEEDMFPVSFRSGWHFMDDVWQGVLNKWIPFSLHNNSPVSTNPTVEPIDNYIKWGEATLDFIPFRPSEENYQVGGGENGWNTRSRYFLRLNDEDLHKIFSQAREGKSQIACVWGHLADNGFVNNMEVSLANIYRVAEEYPDVKFKFSRAVDAYQEWLETQDTTSPELVVDFTTEPVGTNDFQITITTDEPIFQQYPFVGLKNHYEEFRVIEMTEMGENEWISAQTLNASEVAALGIAVTDSVGNLSKEIINIVPEDAIIDNEDDGFTIVSGQWNTKSFNDVKHYWGKDVLTASAAEGDAKVSWSHTFEKSVQQHLYIRFPDYSGQVDSVRIEASDNSTTFFSKTVAARPLERWIYVTSHIPATASEVDVSLSIPSSINEGELIADAVKWSPLQKKRELIADQNWFDMGPVSMDEQNSVTLTLTNNGMEPLTISEISTVNQSIEPQTDALNQDIIIQGFSSFELPIAIHQDNLGVQKDTLKILSDSETGAGMNIPFRFDAYPSIAITDDMDASNYEETGSWRTSVTQTYGERSRYASVNTDDKAMFSATVAYAGIYDVGFIVPKTENGALRAIYTLFINAEQSNTIVVNQNDGSGFWNSLFLADVAVGDELKLEISSAGGDQGNVVLRADAARFLYIGKSLESLLIDNSDADAYSETGNWQTSSASGDYGSTRYVYPEPEAQATYSIEAPKTAVYHLEMIVPETENATLKAKYTAHADGNFLGSAVLNQNTKSGSWRSVGSWVANEGDSLTLTITGPEDPQPGKVLRTDAIQWRYDTNPLSAENALNLPTQFNLADNYPNPFNPTTVIPYHIAGQSTVTIDVFNTVGQKIATLVNNEIKSAGSHHVRFDAKNLSSGVYFYRIQAGTFSEIKKMVLIK